MPDAGMPDDTVPEPGDASDHEGVPADLVELHQVLDWQRAEAAGEGTAQ